MINLFTIGFTQTTAENFFERLRNAGVRKVLDVRLKNTSQLSAFAKAGDLTYFLRSICDIEYAHHDILAPEARMLKDYKKDKGDWGIYEFNFRNLMRERKIENRLSPQIFDGACLLCSEAKPHHCHRKIVCEYLNEKWGGILNVSHL